MFQKSDDSVEHITLCFKSLMTPVEHRNSRLKILTNQVEHRTLCFKSLMTSVEHRTSCLKRLMTPVEHRTACLKSINDSSGTQNCMSQKY